MARLIIVVSCDNVGATQCNIGACGHGVWLIVALQQSDLECRSSILATKTTKGTKVEIWRQQAIPSWVS